jgi:hypothetical protein
MMAVVLAYTSPAIGHLYPFCAPLSRPLRSQNSSAVYRLGALAMPPVIHGPRPTQLVGDVAHTHRLEASERQALRRRLEADYACIRLRKR